MKMRHLGPGLAAVLGAFLVAGCADGGITEVATAAGPEPVANLTETEPVCEVIDFDGFGHGEGVNSVSLPTLGLNLTVSSSPFVQPDGSANLNTTPRAFDTSVPAASWEDVDLIDDSSGGICNDCGPLGKVLVIEDERGFAIWGDYRWGGRLSFSGFGPSDYIESYNAVDDDDGEPSIDLFVGGVKVGASTGQGDGSVELVTTSAHTLSGGIAVFELGTLPADGITGSGGIDNIKVCRPPEETGNEGCTIGYWKTHSKYAPGNQRNAWLSTPYNADQTLGSVFDVPNSYGLDDVTLHEALSLKGGSSVADKAALLLKQAVGALLNASSTEVDYPLTTAQVISQVNAALASGNKNTIQDLQKQLDDFNNLGCPIS